MNPVLQAARLYVSWDNHDMEGLLALVGEITDVKNAQDIIIALFISKETPIETFRELIVKAALLSLGYVLGNQHYLAA